MYVCMYVCMYVGEHVYRPSLLCNRVIDKIDNNNNQVPVGTGRCTGNFHDIIANYVV